MYNQEEPYYSIERRKEVRDAARKLRKQFLKYQEAEIVYSMSHRKIMQEQHSRVFHIRKCSVMASAV